MGLAILLIILLLMVQHSFLTYPFSLWVLSKLKPVPLPQADNPTAKQIAVLMCCRNEENLLPQKLREFAAWREEAQKDKFTLKFFIYNDASTDETPLLLNMFAKTFPSYVTIVHGETQQGKTIGMNTLVAALPEEVELLIFTDPTVTIAGPVLQTLKETFRDTTIGGLTGDLQFKNAGETTATEVSNHFGRLQHRCRVLESATGSISGCSGAFFAIRSGLYRQLPAHIMDDLSTSLGVVLQNQRFIYAPNLIIHKQAAANPKEELKRKIRIACRQVNVLKHLGRRLNKTSRLDQYKFHSKYTLRWLTGFFLTFAGVIILIMIAGSLGWQWALYLAALGFLTLYFSWCFHIPVLSKLANAFIVLNVVTYGISLGFMGVKYQTWQPAKSMRQG